MTTRLAAPPAATPGIDGQDANGYDATIVYAHYFVGGADWLITEHDRESGQMFGWACLGNRDNAELGYVNLRELSEARVRGMWRVEKETDWEPCTLTDAIATVDMRAGRLIGVHR
jgi:hypothetical protein